MDFTLSTIGFSSSSLPSASFIGKRRRLASPANEVLPLHPECGSGCDCDSDGDVGNEQTIGSQCRSSLLSLVQNQFFHTNKNTLSSSSRVGKGSLKMKTLHGSKQNDDNDDDDDDDTASTVSTSTSSESLEEEEEEEEQDQDCSIVNHTPSRKSVSFSYPLVTKVYTRPTTTLEDKYYLHYSDVDYLDFKIGYITGRDRTRKVSFARDVVTHVASIPSINDNTIKQSLYYSESELQRFLDEFVQSLHQRM